VLAAILVAAIVAWVYWRQPVRSYGAAELVQMLPPDHAVHAYLDVALLRSSGYLDLLAGAKANEEPDYKKFVDETDFDYRKDLDAAALAFRNGSVYMALRGRFHWERLRAYAASHGGRCESETFCSLPSSTEGRTISFYRLGPDLLALASSPDERGAALIGPLHWKTPPVIPPSVLWVSAPPFVFTDVNHLPAGSHSFLSPLAQSQGVTFTMSPASGRNLELRMEVKTATPEAAAEMAKQFTSTTDLFASMLKRDKMAANPSDLSGVLVAGRFSAHDSEVTGVWPIDRRFVERLLSGQIQ
jgi:hypothetical protein